MSDESTSNFNIPFLLVQHINASYNVDSRAVQLYNMYKGNVGHDILVKYCTINLLETNESTPREE